MSSEKSKSGAGDRFSAEQVCHAFDVPVLRGPKGEPFAMIESCVPDDAGDGLKVTLRALPGKEKEFREIIQATSGASLGIPMGYMVESVERWWIDGEPDPSGRVPVGLLSSEKGES